MPVIKLKRAYERPSKKDRERILVERFRQRGMTKQTARVDMRLKEIAPSTDLRKRFAHDTDQWAEFCARYRSELKEKTELIDQLKRKAKTTTVTLVYSARDPQHNSALLLKEFVEKLSR